MENENKNDPADKISENVKKFQAYNSLRLTWFHDSLSNKEIVDLIDAIPLLIIINRQGIPGYVENFEPIGMHGYQPSNSSIKFINQRFPSANLSSISNTRQVIEVFAIIGSAGSIAYNEDSDIDFWICFDGNNINQGEIEKLREKLKGIEMWITESFNMETHFYLNDIPKIRNDIFDADEDDISGKSMGKLMKDEFYRSSILLKGKIPFWWAVPSISDSGYKKYLSLISKTGMEKNFVDLGNLYTIKKEDFFGAGLFQILKSLGNPFKSILKIGILESYLLGDNRESPFLCNLLKSHVQESKLDFDHIDPYILLYNQVHDYYSNNADNLNAMSIDILNMCFYIKIDPNLSKFTTLQKDHYVRVVEDQSNNISFERNTKLPAKIEKMLEFNKIWNWNDNKLKKIDNFKNWDIKVITKFWNNVTKQILKSYKNILNNIESQKASQKFSSEELKYISRKIYSSLSFSENKIKQAVTFKDNPIEKYLVIESIIEKKCSVTWLLSRGFSKDKVNSDNVIFHRESSLIALLAWVSINRMFQKDYTRVDIKSRYHILDSVFVRDLLSELTLHFSIKKLNVRNKYFFSDPFPILNFIIINLYSKYPKGIESIYYLFHNSWGETVFQEYTGEMDIANMITQLLNGAINHREIFEDSVWLTSPYPYRASKSFKMIHFLLEDIYNFFVIPENEGIFERKYITILGNNFVVFSYRKTQKVEKILCNIYNSEIKMLYSLSNVIGVKNVIRVNQDFEELNHLRTIIDNNKEGAIQIYYEEERKYCNFYITDERGSLIFIRKNSETFIDYLTRLYLFSKNLISQIIESNPNSTLNHSEKNLEIFELKRNTLNKCHINEVNDVIFERLIRNEKKIVPFVISLHLLENGELGYRFSLPDGGRSEIFNKSNLNEIAENMIVLMGSIKEYNYYISDINLSNIDFKIYKNFSSFSFAEKNRFELIMEKHIRVGLINR